MHYNTYFPKCNHKFSISKTFFNGHNSTTNMHKTTHTDQLIPHPSNSGFIKNIPNAFNAVIYIEFNDTTVPRSLDFIRL